MDKGHETYTDGQEGDSLVDSPQGRDVDSLSTDGTLGTDSGRVFSGTGVDDSVNCNDNQPLSNCYRTEIKNSPRTWIGFCSVTRWMISKACWTIRTAMIFLPLFRPFIMRLYPNPNQLPLFYRILAKSTHALTSRSTMGIRPLANCFLAYRPAVWADSYCKIVTFDTKTRCVTHGRRQRG